MKQLNARTIIYVLYAVAAIAVAGVAAWLMRSVSQSEIGIDVDQRINLTPQQIESIRDIGQWEFLAVSDEQMVDTTRRGFFSDDHLVRIYYGTLRIGVDLQRTKPDWIHADGDSIVVVLPPVGLLDDDFIDEARTKSFHESGRWSGADREALYRRARQKMVSHAINEQNLASARQIGEEQFRNLMRSLGFERVVIRWEE